MVRFSRLTEPKRVAGPKFFMATNDDVASDEAMTEKERLLRGAIRDYYDQVYHRDAGFEARSPIISVDWRGTFSLGRASGFSTSVAEAGRGCAPRPILAPFPPEWTFPKWRSTLANARCFRLTFIVVCGEPSFHRSPI